MRIGNLGFTELAKREYLVTNGLGGYSSSTIIGMNSRKYHGLLVASVSGRRHVMVNSVDESIIRGERIDYFCTNSYDVINPHGYKFFKHFEQKTVPETLFVVDKIKINKAVYMLHEKNTTVLHYKIVSKEPAMLKIRPLVSCRHFHSLRKKTDDFSVNVKDNKCIVMFKDSPPLAMIGPSFMADTYWYYNFQYKVERERGFDYAEDSLSPGFFLIEIKKGTTEFDIVFSCDSELPEITKKDLQEEVKRQKELVDEFYKESKVKRSLLATHLALAADSFICRKEPKIVAGYHWFEDYGRDTFIALPGLCLVNNDFEGFRRITLYYLDNMKNGLVPNDFNGTSFDYNSVDASLWLFVAVHRYFSITKDMYFIRQVFGKLEAIIKAYHDGTDFGIKSGQDCLIRTAADNLTWMDAKVGGKPVTPRECAVEIQALWYNAVKVMEVLSFMLSYGFEFNGLSDKIKESFNTKFWNIGQNSLYDTIDPVREDIRPNMLLAIGLPYSILDAEKEKLVLQKVEKELLTARGLRTLSGKDPRFKDCYHGNEDARNLAYHNGTVWPWFVGFYVDAALRLDPKRKSELTKYIRSYADELSTACVGSISEIFDAGTLKPRGCISQAWSVAEILRALWLLGNR